MKITYIGNEYPQIKGKTFEMPDDPRVGFVYMLRYEGVNYSVWRCECECLYDDPLLNAARVVGWAENNKELLENIEKQNIGLNYAS